MKKITLAFLLVIPYNVMSQKTDVTQDSITVKKSLTVGRSKITGIQNDTDFNDSTKIPTSRAVKQFVESKLASGGGVRNGYTASNGAEIVGNDIQLVGRFLNVSEFALFKKNTTSVSVADT